MATDAQIKRALAKNLSPAQVEKALDVANRGGSSGEIFSAVKSPELKRWGSTAYKKAWDLLMTRANEVNSRKNPSRKSVKHQRPPSVRVANAKRKGKQTSRRKASAKALKRRRRNPDIYTDAMASINKHSGGRRSRVYIADVAQDLQQKGYSWADIKRELIEIMRAREIVLFRLDDPQEITPLYEKYVIQSGGQPNHILYLTGQKSSQAKKRREMPIGWTQGSAGFQGGSKKTAKAAPKRPLTKVEAEYAKLLKEAGIDYEPNPKRSRNPKAAGFEAAGKIYRKIEELKKQPITMRRGAAIYKLEKALEKAYASAYAAERAKDSQIYEAPRSFSTAKRKGGSVRKKKANPYIEYEPLDRKGRLALAKKVSGAKDLIRYIKDGWTDGELRVYFASLFGLDTTDIIAVIKYWRKKLGISGASQNPRKRKPAVKARHGIRTTRGMRNPKKKAVQYAVYEISTPFAWAKRVYVKYEPPEMDLAMARKDAGSAVIAALGISSGSKVRADVPPKIVKKLPATAEPARNSEGWAWFDGEWAKNPRKKTSTKRNSVVGSIKKTVKRIFKKKNDGSADREDFAGKVSGFKELYFPPGTPQGLSTLGPLVHIETDKANIKPAKGMAVLCQDSNHRLYVGSTTPDAAAYTGSESLRNQNLGKVQRIEYRCSKPHLGAEYRGNITWYHDFEAPLPVLKTDSDGRFIFSGGNYTIKREGITG